VAAALGGRAEVDQLKASGFRSEWVFRSFRPVVRLVGWAHPRLIRVRQGGASRNLELRA